MVSQIINADISHVCPVRIHRFFSYIYFQDSDWQNPSLYFFFCLIKRNKNQGCRKISRKTALSAAADCAFLTRSHPSKVSQFAGILFVTVGCSLKQKNASAAADSLSLVFHRIFRRPLLQSDTDFIAKSTRSFQIITMRVNDLMNNF
jgi:hypothetical protein